MDSKICFILIGVIALTTGKPVKDDSNILVADENELQQLLKTLYSNGKFDISFSHHEDGPQSHHEDQARISPHDDHSHESHHYEDASHSRDKTRSHDEARSSHGDSHHHDSHHGSHKHTSIHKNPSLTNIQNVNVIYKKKPSKNNYEEGIESVLGLKTKNAADNSVNQLLDLLRNYGKNEEDVGKVGRTSNDDRDDDCGGYRCGRSDDSYIDGNSNNVRLCIGDRCGYGREGREDSDKNSENNGNSNGQILDLVEDISKKVGTVGKSPASDNRDDDCGGGRCGGYGRAGRDDNDSIKIIPIEDLLKHQNGGTVSNRDDDCGGGRCGYGRGGYDNDDRDRDDEDGGGDYIKDVIRADRDRRISEADSYLEQQIKSNAQRYKINDDLDAIVVDMSGLEKSLGNSNDNDRNQKGAISNVRLIENVGYPNVLETGNDDSERQVKRYDVDSDSQPIKAVVVDLSKSEVDLPSQLEGLLKNVQVKSNEDRVSNKYEEESKILSHNEDNNNVYVPQWILEQVVGKTNLRADPVGETSLKHLLPMTAKQKQKIVKAIAIKNSNASKRIFRRSVEDDIGVPFHLQVEGLGQVNP